MNLLYWTILFVFFSFTAYTAYGQAEELREDIVGFQEGKGYTVFAWGWNEFKKEDIELHEMFEAEAGKEYALLVVLGGCKLQVTAHDKGEVFENLTFSQLVEAPDMYQGEQGLPLYYQFQSYENDDYSGFATVQLTVKDVNNTCNQEKFDFHFVFMEKGQSHLENVDDMLQDLISE